MDASTTPRRARRPVPPPRRGERGFTLMELMIVVIMVGLMAGMAATSTDTSAEYRLNLMTVQIRDAVNSAGVQAMSMRETHGVVFDVEADEVFVVDEEGELAIDPLTQQPYVIDFDAPNMPQGVDLVFADFGGGEDSLLIDPQGVPVSGGIVTLICRGTQRMLSVNAATAKVEIIG